MPAAPPPSDSDAARPRWLWGAASPLGLAVAGVTFAVDQIHKAWMLYWVAIREGQTITVTPFLDLVLVWNRGISYGLLQQETQLGRALLIGFAAIAVLVLAAWLARTTSRLAATAIGLIIGGALGNAVDRAVYGAVADFFSLHAFGFYWYVFNIADVAIVMGVAGLMYEAALGGHKKV